jgi:hypothetical protein
MELCTEQNPVAARLHEFQEDLTNLADEMNRPLLAKETPLSAHLVSAAIVEGASLILGVT